jgi:hypothetical protein
MNLWLGFLALSALAIIWAVIKVWDGYVPWEDYDDQD